MAVIKFIVSLFAISANGPIGSNTPLQSVDYPSNRRSLRFSISVEVQYYSIHDIEALLVVAAVS